MVMMSGAVGQQHSTVRGSLAGACVYQAHYSCSALSTKQTTIAQYSAPSTLLLLSTITILLSTQHKEHYECWALSTQCHCKGAYCHLHRLAIHKFVLSKNWRVNVIDIQRVCFADIQFYNRVLLLVISAISSKCTSLCTLYNVNCTVYILRAHQHLVPWPALLLLKELPPANILQSNPFLCTKCSVMKNSASISVFL